MKRIALSTLLGCFVFLIGGSILGVDLNLRYGPPPVPQPNHIVFQVLPTSKVSLVPSVGDIIDWQDATGQPLSAEFPAIQDRSPCKGSTSTSHCEVVVPSQEGAVYPYTCHGCYDPEIGPVSKGGPIVGGKVVTQRPLLSVFFFDLRRALGFSTTTKDGDMNKSPLPTPPAKGPVAAMAGSIVQPAATCTNDTVALYMLGQSQPNQPVAVSDNSIVGFTGTIKVVATMPINAKGLPLCPTGPAPSTSKPCTVASDAQGTYTYTLSVALPSKCTNATSEKFFIQ